MGATVDCETIRSDLLGQPVNALSSLALVAAGVWLLRRAGARWVGFALITTGVGSFLFHGPLAPAGEWVHDVTLAWLFAVIIGELRRSPPGFHLLALCTLAVTFAVLPATTTWITGGLTVIVAVTLLLDDRSRRTWLPLSLLASVAVIGRLGASGGPLCDTGSLLQPHALWHTGSAIAVMWWAEARASAMSALHRDHRPSRTSHRGS